MQNWNSVYDENIKAPKATNGQGYGHVFYDNTKSMFDKVKTFKKLICLLHAFINRLVM